MKKSYIFIIFLIISILGYIYYLFFGVNIHFTVDSKFIKSLLLFLLLVPIFINILLLYICDLIEENIDKNLSSKYMPSLITKFILEMKDIINNKEVLTYFRTTNHAELLFFIVLLIINCTLLITTNLTNLSKQ